MTIVLKWINTHARAISDINQQSAMASKSKNTETCIKCKKTFDNKRDLFKHRSEQCRPNRCPLCLQVFAKSADLYNHTHNRKKVTCDHCNRVFCDESTYQRHIRSLRDITDDSVRDLDQRIYPETGYENEDGYQEIIESKHNEIRDRTKENKHYKVVNMHIDPSFTYREINDFLLDLYSKHKNSFKVNLGFGYVLYHTISEIYKYHYVSTNNLLFERAVVITNLKDITDLLNHIISLDLATNFYLKKPSSGWILAGLTNIQYIVTEMKKVPIGLPVQLPDYIKNSKSMYSLTHNFSTGQVYDDQNCF